MERTFSPCDECEYAFHKQNQESGMCRICEFKKMQMEAQYMGIAQAKFKQELDWYKKLEEQGLLLRLPCKVGDTIYQPLMDGQINEYKVIGLCYDITYKKWLLEVAIQLVGDEWFKTTCEIECIGKTVFLTKEEAERKLESMKGE